MSIMTGSLEKFSLPYMKQMAFTDSLTEYKTAIKAWESRLLALYQDCAARSKAQPWNGQSFIQSRQLNSSKPLLCG